MRNARVDFDEVEYSERQLVPNPAPEESRSREFT